MAHPILLRRATELQVVRESGDALPTAEPSPSAANDEKQNFHNTHGFILVLHGAATLGIFILCWIFFSCATNRWRLNRRRAQPPQPSRQHTNIRAPETLLSIDEILLPVSNEFPMEAEAACSICLEPLSSGSRICSLECSHVFHVDCVSSWLMRRTRSFCPVCRKTVMTDGRRSSGSTLV